MAKAAVKGAQGAGAEVTLYRIAETLPPEVLAKMHAATPPTDIPVVTPDDLTKYDGILFGAPTRYGQPAAQYKALWDSTGGLWETGALNGKLAGFFVGTGTVGEWSVERKDCGLLLWDCDVGRRTGDDGLHQHGALRTPRNDLCTHGVWGSR